MRLPEGQYSTIASVGRKCQPAGRLKRLGLRSFSGPFDWFASQSLKQVEFIFRNGIKHIFSRENLVFRGENDKCLRVKCKVSKFNSIHDYSLPECNDDFELFHENFKNKINKRYDNLIKKILSSERVLLVRLDADKDQAISLVEYLNNKYKGIVIDLLVINEGDSYPSVEYEEWGHANIFAYKSNNSPSGPKWLGSDELWNTLFSNVKLI